MPQPRPFDDALDKVARKPALAAEATQKTWSFVWPLLTPEVAAEQAAKLAEFFAAEVIRLEKES